jgi:hypothetical protein
MEEFDEIASVQKFDDEWSKEVGDEEKGEDVSDDVFFGFHGAVGLDDKKGEGYEGGVEKEGYCFFDKFALNLSCGGVSAFHIGGKFYVDCNDDVDDLDTEGEDDGHDDIGGIFELFLGDGDLEHS